MGELCLLLCFEPEIFTLFLSALLQRILEHCSDDEETHCIIDEILESAFALAHDQYGNYVTQVWLILDPKSLLTFS